MPTDVNHLVGDRTLPRPTGPYLVGYSDVEFEARCGRRVLCRLHYPLPSASSIDYAADNRGLWLPSEHYHPGYGYYLRIPQWLSGALFRYIAGHVQVWAVKAAPQRPGNLRGAIILSHGLGGIRTTYSTLCSDLSSHGYLVAAVEHRDGSASITVDSQGRALPYMFPGEHYEFNFRNMQLAQRGEELRAVKDFLSGQYNAIISSDIPGIIESVKCDPNVVPFYGIGHSMGAASVISASDLFTAIVALDPWTFPLSLDTSPITPPCLIVSCENFSWPNNNDRLIALMAKQPTRRFLMIKKADHADQSDVPVVMPEVVRWRMRSKGCVEPEVIIRMTAECVRDFLANGAVGCIDESAVTVIR